MAQRAVDPKLGPELAKQAVAVVVEEVLYGTDVLRGLVGHEVTVISDDPGGLDRAGPLVLFTNCISLGDRVVAREISRRDATRAAVRDVREAVRDMAERPLAERVATADLIVVGEVLESRPLEPDAPPTSEHDPEWWIARVAVGSVLKGRTRRKAVDVVFANSRDIAWYRSPKLHEGASGVLLLAAWADEEAAPAPAGAYRCTDPLDFQPAERVGDIRRLAGAEAEGG